MDALSIITDSESTYTRGRALCKSLKEVIPRQMFEVVIQDAIGSKISDYLIKPVNPNQILLTIKKNLESLDLINNKTNFICCKC